MIEIKFSAMRTLSRINHLEEYPEAAYQMYVMDLAKSHFADSFTHIFNKFVANISKYLVHRITTIIADYFRKCSRPCQGNCSYTIYDPYGRL